MKDKYPNGLKQAMERAHVGPSELARQVGTSRQQVSRYMNAEYELNREWAERFAPILHVRPEALIFAEEGGRQAEPGSQQPAYGYKPPPDLFVSKDVPIYGSVEGGPGEIVVTNEIIDYTFRPEFLKHVKDAYALYIVGTSMEPRYEPGEKVYVHPKAPLVRDKDAIFCMQAEDGDFKASIKRLLRWTESQWYVKQWNPAKEFWLPRRSWSKAYRVFGRIDF